MKNTNEHFAKLESLIDDTKIAMLVTKSANGKSIGRPISTAQLDDDGLPAWIYCLDINRR